MKKMKKVLASLLSVALVASLFCGCAKTEVAQTETKVEVQTEVKSEESNVIMRTGVLTVMNVMDYNNDPRYPTQCYDDLNSMILAYQSGKIDSMYRFPLVTAKYIENHVEGVEVVQPQSATGTLGLCIGTLKENTEVYNLFNDAIKELLKKGTIGKLKEEYINKYMRTYEDPKPIDMPILDGAKTVKIAITGDLPPIDFVAADGRPAGFNVALLSEISKLTNTNIELVQMNSGARLTALKTNAVDAVFYNSQFKYDDEEDDEILSKDDLPNEIIITEPYYTSRIYEVDSSKKLDELAEKGIISSQERTQKDEMLNSGILARAAITEEEENASMKQYDMGINVKHYDNLSSMMFALRSKKIDNIGLLPMSTAKYIKARNDDVVIEDRQSNALVEYYMATLEENKEVYNLLNDTLNEIIKDGTIKNIEAKYIDGFIEDNGEPQSIDMPHFDGAKTIKVAVTGDLPPFDFVLADGNPAGYNAALLSEIANRAKVNITFVTMDERAKVTALATNNVDAVFWLVGLNPTGESTYYYDCPDDVILTDCYFKDKASWISLKK